MAAICNLGCSCDIVTYRLKWPRCQIAHAHVLHRLYLYTLSLLSLRLSSAIKKLLWTTSLQLNNNCYYILFSQQQLGHAGTFQIIAQHRDGSERFQKKYRHRCNVQMIGARRATAWGEEGGGALWAIYQLHHMADILPGKTLSIKRKY